MRHSVTTLPHHKAAITRLGINSLITPRNELILSHTIHNHKSWMGRRGLPVALVPDWWSSHGRSQCFSIMQFTKSRTHGHVSSPRVWAWISWTSVTGLEWTTGSEGPTPQFLNSMLPSLRNYALANLLCVWSCTWHCPMAEYLFHIKVIVFL